MDITQSFPSKYLQQSDFASPRHVIIDTVAVEDVSMDDKPAEMKPVIYYKGAPKGQILNKTNSKILAMLFGNETTAWAGQTVEVFNDVTVMYKGELKGGLRCRPISGAAFVPPTGVAQEQPVGHPSVVVADPTFDDDVPGW
jgi:hypothetical protein